MRYISVFSILDFKPLNENKGLKSKIRHKFTIYTAFSSLCVDCDVNISFFDLQISSQFETTYDNTIVKYRNDRT